PRNAGSPAPELPVSALFTAFLRRACAQAPIPPMTIPRNTETRIIRKRGTSKPSAGAAVSKGSRLKVTSPRLATAIAMASAITGGRTIQRRSFNGLLPVQNDPAEAAADGSVVVAVAVVVIHQLVVGNIGVVEALAQFLARLEEGHRLFLD